MGRQQYVSNGTTVSQQFTPIPGITTYNFIVVGAGGGGGGCVIDSVIGGNGGNGCVVSTTYTGITKPLDIIVGGGGGGGISIVTGSGYPIGAFSGGGGGGLTQVFSNQINIIAGGGGGGIFGYFDDGGNGGNGGNNGSNGDGIADSGGRGGNLNGTGGTGGTGFTSGGSGGNFNLNTAGGTPNGGGGASINGITGIGFGGGGGSYNSGLGGINGGGGGAAGYGGGGAAGYGGGGGGGGGGQAGGGGGGGGSSSVLLNGLNPVYSAAPYQSLTYGTGGLSTIQTPIPETPYYLAQKGYDGYVLITWDDLIISDICFPAGTPIKTDQGLINIEQLDSSKHTIQQQPILYITQTTTLDKYLICFEKNSLGLNKPSQKTIMSKEHKIYFKGQLVPAYRFLKFSKQVIPVKYSGETLYNVLLEDYGLMEVNNLMCETLHPDNTVVKNTFRKSVAKKHF